jgi:hypothetical protein
MDPFDQKGIEVHLRREFAAENFLISQHAQQEMVEENILLAEVIEAMAICRLLENYPEHQRGACGLFHGLTGFGRAIHVVCTTIRPIPIIITVYEPTPPKWVNPFERGDNS